MGRYWLAAYRDGRTQGMDTVVAANDQSFLAPDSMIDAVRNSFDIKKIKP